MQTTTAYLKGLTNTVEQIIRTISELEKTYPSEKLAQRPTPEQWSVFDNLEHLNLYGDFYLPVFEKTIERGVRKGLKAHAHYQSGWLGSYFTKSMRPAGEKIPNPMKTFKSKDPILTEVPDNVLERFLAQQNRLLNTLQRAERTDIQKLRIPTTLGSFPTIRLGDGFDFFIAHEERHMLQIQRTLETLGLELKPIIRWG